MATTGLPPAATADLSRVTESLEMISPRWSVWVLMTLSDKPLRYSEIKVKLPQLHDGQLHPRLRKLTDAGLVQRTAYSQRHVTYGLTVRGAALMPVLSVIAAWGDTHLENDLVLDEATGRTEPERITPAQNVEDTVALLAPRHATTILWVLKDRGACGARALASIVMPTSTWTNIYPPLRRVVDDGLVEPGEGSVYQLSASGRDLAPLYRAVSAWAAGRPLTEVRTYPVWGQAPALSHDEPGTWVTHQSRSPAPSASAKWQGSDLFSHRIPARALSASPAGGHRR